jgi:hypothetical protein
MQRVKLLPCDYEVMGSSPIHSGRALLQTLREQELRAPDCFFRGNDYLAPCFFLSYIRRSIPNCFPLFGRILTLHETVKFMRAPS